jgi:pimeloyl-ACP methyl ester carboxylesterase
MPHCFFSLKRFSSALADRLILSPTRHWLPAPGKAPLYLAYEDGYLEVWVQHSEAGARAHPGPLVLKFPGTGSRAEDADDLALHCCVDREVTIWSVNPPGYGNSGGRASLGNIPIMAMTAIREVREAANGRPVIAEGFSLGCVAALFLAARGEVDGLILRNPPPLREVVRHRTARWGFGPVAALINGGIPESIDSVRNATACSVPALFVVALRDQVVPAHCQRLVLDAYGGDRQLLERTEADHATPLSESEASRLNQMASWLLDCVEHQRSGSQRNAGRSGERRDKP